MKNLILLRGASGSGKTTFAELLYHMTHNFYGGPVIKYKDSPDILDYFCADDYFTSKEGEYLFDPAKLSDAHENCQDRTKKAMKKEIPLIVIHNTFTMEWEMDPYLDLADRHNYQVTSIIVENRHGSESEHGVPTEILTRQKERFEIKL